jgi:hypothetical protein
MGHYNSKLAGSHRQKKKANANGNASSSIRTDDQWTDPPLPTRYESNVRMAEIYQAVAEGKTVIQGLYDYIAADAGDLSFHKGDYMIVTNKDGDWWYVEHMYTHQKGYIPFNYVAEFSGLEKFEWFHGKISRKDAENMLTSPGNPRGTFLIRESESATGSYSLSILDESPSRERVIKHYRIRDLDNGGCYISPKQKCDSLEDLVRHYQGQSDGLCYRLIKPCPKSQPTRQDLSHNMKDAYECARSEVQMTKLLGSGNFGEVWEGVWKGKQPVAIKTLKVGTMEPQKFLEEAEIMKKLRHPHVVTLYAVCSREEPILIVCELMCNGSLLGCLRDDKQKPFLLWPRLVDIASQVADGMKYVEGLNKIHRDLAARNVLVGANYLIKIGDFGLARDDETYEAKLGSKFPIKWTAPEAAMYGTFTIKSDVWAYGILLIELVTYGQIPYPGMTNSEVLTQLERGYRHPRPQNCEPAMYDIMLSCWKKKPEDRPTFEHLHDIMSNYQVAVERQYAESN